MADKPNLNTFSADSKVSVSKLNENFEILANAVMAALGRGGTSESPNSMEGDLDMDLNEILNAGYPTKDEAVTSKRYVDDRDEYYDQLSRQRDATLEDADSTLQSQIIDNYNGYTAADANIQAQLTGDVPLEASAFSPISWHDQIVETSVTIPDNKNAWSFGPTVSLAEGVTVTVGSGSYWTIADGEVTV